MSGTLLDTMKQLKSQLAQQDRCNWRSTTGCIFKDYVRADGKCSVPGATNPSYTGLETYDENTLKIWLQALYNRNIGNDPRKSEAANVYEYWNTCKNVPGYEFLRSLNFAPVGIEEDNTRLIEADKGLANKYINSKRDQFQELQNLQLVRDDLERKIQLLQSRQDQNLENTRISIEENIHKLNELDSKISVMRRQTMYDMEGDLIHNSKIFFLGNLTFYFILFFIVVFTIRQFRK